MQSKPSLSKLIDFYTQEVCIYCYIFKNLCQFCNKNFVKISKFISTYIHEKNY